LILYIQVAAATALWCFFHSLFITHLWRDTVCRRVPACAPYGRVVYVMASSASLAVLFWWLRTLPETTVFVWEGLWQVFRVVGLVEAGVLLILGALAYDGRSFLGLRQVTDHHSGHQPSEPAFSRRGVLGVIRHPWYTGTLIFLVFCLPYTDINLVWRTVFLVYTLVGTELEERKLLKELGPVYEEYRREVPRFFPALSPRRRP
jgi:protein-S-isoprenylcysteine O-methyltransferase Ste14